MMRTVRREKIIQGVNMKTKIIMIVLTVMCMMCIFLLSSQTAAESDSMSVALTQKLIDIAGRISVPGTQAFVKKYIFNNAVRNYAHFAMFFLFGLVSAGAAFSVMKDRYVLPWACSLAFCAVWAVLDEVHQMFVPGRGCEMKDMKTDFAGILISTLLFTAVRGISALLNEREKRDTLQFDPGPYRLRLGSRRAGYAVLRKEG